MQKEIGLQINLKKTKAMNMKQEENKETNEKITRKLAKIYSMLEK